MSRTRPHQSQYYTAREEIANGITHGFGMVLSLAGSIVLITIAVIDGTTRQIVSFAIFAGSLLLLYVASTLYHSLPHSPVKRVFRTLDHMAIYLLIAGTYTPFMLINLRGARGWSIFAIIWACAILGIILKSVSMTKFQAFSVVLYVGMGWLCLVVFKEILRQVPQLSIIFIIFGGVSYTTGLIFYWWRSLPYHHAVWHLFVLGGSISHYFAVLYSVRNT
jgi:hemolysin III